MTQNTPTNIPSDREEVPNILPQLDAKSIIEILSLAMAPETMVELCAEGADENEAVDALVALIESGFGE